MKIGFVFVCWLIYNVTLWTIQTKIQIEMLKIKNSLVLFGCWKNMYEQIAELRIESNLYCQTVFIKHSKSCNSNACSKVH